MNKVLIYNPERVSLPSLSANINAFIRGELSSALAVAETFGVDAVVVLTTQEREKREKALTLLRRKTMAPIIIKSSPIDAEFFYSAGADNVFVSDSDGLFNLNLKALLRLSERLLGLKETDSVELKGYYISLAEYVLRLNGQNIKLPRKELELLFFLSKNEGRVFTRNEILDEVWGVDFSLDPRTVDVHIRRLRKKLQGSDYCLKTVPRVGYGFFSEK